MNEHSWLTRGHPHYGKRRLREDLGLALMACERLALLLALSLVLSIVLWAWWH